MLKSNVLNYLKIHFFAGPGSSTKEKTAAFSFRVAQIWNCTGIPALFDVFAR